MDIVLFVTPLQKTWNKDFAGIIAYRLKHLGRMGIAKGTEEYGNL